MSVIEPIEKKYAGIINGVMLDFLSVSRLLCLIAMVVVLIVEFG